MAGAHPTLPPVQARVAALLSQWGSAGGELVAAYVHGSRAGFGDVLMRCLREARPPLTPSGAPTHLYEFGPEIRVGKAVGSGTYGTVHRASAQGGRALVLKRVRWPAESEAPLDSAAYDFASELLAHAVVATDPQHAAAVPALFGAGWYWASPHGGHDQLECFLLMEDLHDATLHRELQEASRDGAASWAAIRQPLLDVAALLQPLKQRYGFNHRDLKPSNIMRRDSTGALCLIDMGFACLSMDGAPIRAGPFFSAHSACDSPYQDMALLLLYVREHVSLEATARRVLDELLRTRDGRDLAEVARAHWRKHRRPAAAEPPLVHMAYNSRSNLYAPSGAVDVPGADVRAFPARLREAEVAVAAVALPMLSRMAASQHAVLEAALQAVQVARRGDGAATPYAGKKHGRSSPGSGRNATQRRRLSPGSAGTRQLRAQRPPFALDAATA